MLVFKERGKPEYPEKNLSEQGREPTTNSTHIWRRRQDSNPGHIGGRRVLSPLHHPCSPREKGEISSNHISCYCQMNKTFEHPLSKQITAHYDPILYQRISAYKKHHSCQNTLLSLVEDWKSALDRKEIAYILTTDISKAFDSLYHSLIVKKAGGLWL